MDSERSSSAKSLDHESTARRAFEIWESRGRPNDASEAIWFEAERSLAAEANRAKEPPPDSDEASRPTPRSTSRTKKTPVAPPERAAWAEPDHFVVLLDRGHLRIYAEEKPVGNHEARYVQVDSLDFPAGQNSYTDNDTDQAGRFPGSRGRPAGMSIDERLPMQRARDQKLAEQMAERITTFLQARPRATWDFAAGPAMNHAVLERLPKEPRARLQQTLTKDLTNFHPSELRGRFGHGRS